MNNQRDIEFGQDSPVSAGDGSEVVSPMVTGAGRVSPTARNQKQQSKVLMMSTTDRESLSGKSPRLRAPIPHRKPSMEKTCKTYGSMCMAVFLFAGGISLFISGCVLLSSRSDSYATGMIIVGVIMVVPGMYGMTKVVKFLQRRQAILHRAAQGRGGALPPEALMMEAEEEFD